MFDERSFDIRSFDTRSWLIALLEDLDFSKLLRAKHILLLPNELFLRKRDDERVA